MVNVFNEKIKIYFDFLLLVVVIDLDIFVIECFLVVIFFFLRLI